jgi:hypothetical protein
LTGEISPNFQSISYEDNGNIAIATKKNGDVFVVNLQFDNAPNMTRIISSCKITSYNSEIIKLIHNEHDTVATINRKTMEVSPWAYE